jgi:hypothetical protein
MFDTFHADLARNHLSPSVSVSYFHGNLCWKLEAVNISWIRIWSDRNVTEKLTIQLKGVITFTIYPVICTI